VKRTLLLLTLGIASLPGFAASLPDAFTEGSTFGRAGNAAARSRIDTGTARTIVPGYTPSAPASSYFGGPGISEGTAATLADCTGPAAASLPACQAINFTQTNPGKRPAFTLTPSDPLLAKAKTITADPHAIAGAITGTYSACTTATRTSPDIVETRVCNEARTLDRLTCQKVLSVSVIDNGLNCSPGSYLTANPRILFIRPYVFVGAICADDIRFQWAYGYSECNGTNATITVPSVVPTEDPIRMLVGLGCGGTYVLQGSCPGGACAYTVGLPGTEEECLEPCEEGCCRYGIRDEVLASFTFTRPVRTYSITDAWDNQCAPLEARLP